MPRISTFIPVGLAGLLLVNPLRAQEEAKENSDPTMAELSGTAGRIDGKTPVERAAALVRNTDSHRVIPCRP